MRKPVVNSMAIAMLLLVPLTGCQTVSESPKSVIGGLGGAATGGLIAAAAGAGGAGIAAGVIGGALVGNVLDQRDRELQAKAASQALENTPSGKPVAWQNPDNGHAGTITPTRTYQTAQGASTSRRSPSTARRRTRTEPPAVSRTAAERSSADHAKHRGRSHEYSPTRIV
jgi:surface antigen